MAESDIFGWCLKTSDSNIVIKTVNIAVEPVKLCKAIHCIFADRHVPGSSLLFKYIPLLVSRPSKSFVNSEQKHRELLFMCANGMCKLDFLKSITDELLSLNYVSKNLIR